jgi:hypothetical protein
METSPPLEHFIDEAEGLLGHDEQYPVSTLQRKFRIGYISAQRLYQLVQERRSRLIINYRSVLNAAWAKAMLQYDQGKVNSECTLHSYLYSQLLLALPECIILCEPQLNIPRYGVFVPDIVVLKEDQIVVVMEIKFVPQGYPVFELDIAKMQTIGIDEDGADHHLLLDPATGKFLTKKSRISKACLLCFAVIGRSDAKAVCADNLKAALTTGGGTNLVDRFLALVRTTSELPANAVGCKPSDSYLDGNSPLQHDN